MNINRIIRNSIIPVFIASLLAVSVGACGGGSSSPVTPTNNFPQVVVSD